MSGPDLVGQRPQRRQPRRPARPERGRPWRLAVPSYIIPGTYLENVAYLEALPEVQGVELLFYFFDGETRELLERERDGLRARQGRFTYSVHLPDHLREEHRVLLELVRGLAGACVLHPPPAGESEFIDLVRRWRREFGDIFLLENLVGRSFERLAAELKDIPLCLDTGHLLLNEARPSAFLGTYGPRIREIHLHGVREGVDHRPPAPGEAWLAELAPFLRRFEGTVNLEIFSRDDLDSSLLALRDAGLLE